jgi:hypothetical protein
MWTRYLSIPMTGLSKLEQIFRLRFCSGRGVDAAIVFEKNQSKTIPLFLMFVDWHNGACDDYRKKGVRSGSWQNPTVLEELFQGGQQMG